jgi:hypothetical protein
MDKKADRFGLKEDGTYRLSNYSTTLEPKTTVRYMYKGSQGLDVDETLNAFSRVCIRETDYPIDFSNKIFHKGKPVDIPSLSYDDKLTLLNELNYDQLQKYNNLECVRSENYIATPTRKMHYPEPFIASASFIHTDIGFIHILHYQF